MRQQTKLLYSSDAKKDHEAEIMLNYSFILMHT